jgi:hypothetical protein
MIIMNARNMRSYNAIFKFVFLNTYTYNKSIL